MSRFVKFSQQPLEAKLFSAVRVRLIDGVGNDLIFPLDLFRLLTRSSALSFHAYLMAHVTAYVLLQHYLTTLS